MNSYDYVAVSYDDGWQIHRHGCADVEKLRRKNAHVTVEYATSPEALREHALKGGLTDMGFDENDIRIMPCAK